MRHVTLNNAREAFDSYFYDVIKYGLAVSIATDDGAAILVSQEKWNGLMETLYLESMPCMTESIKEARETPANERLVDIGWDID